MERRPALVTAGALTATVSATVSGLFLTVVNTPGLETPVEPAQVVTEYIFQDAPAVTTPPMEVVVAEPTAAGTTGYEDYDEYFENEADEGEYDDD